MKVKIHSTIKVNLAKIVKDCEILVSKDELNSEIKHIIGFWAEQRLKEEGWPLPSAAQDIREYLIENGTIREYLAGEDEPDV